MKDVGMSFLKVKSLRRKIQECTQQQLLAKTGDATDGRDVDTDESLGKSKTGDATDGRDVDTDESLG